MTTASNWRDANPGLLSFSQLTGIDTDIHENKAEIYYRDDEGESKSCNPRRYEYDYESSVTILVDSPWFDKIELEPSSGNRPDSPYTSLYRQYEEQMHTLYDILISLTGKTFLRLLSTLLSKPVNRRSWRPSSRLPHGFAEPASIQTYTPLPERQGCAARHWGRCPGSRDPH